MQIKKNGMAEVVLASIAIFATTALLWVRINSGWLDSDKLYMEGIARDLFLLGGRWSDWKFSPAPDYFPDMLLYLISAKFVDSTIWRIFIVTVLQVIFLSIVVTALARCIYSKVSAIAISIVLLFIGLFSLASAKGDIWLYFYSTNSHFSSLLFALFNFANAILFFRRPTWQRICLIVTTGVLAALSTKIYLLSYLFPAVTFSVFLLTSKGRQFFPSIGFRTKSVFLASSIVTFLGEAALSRIVSRNDVLGQRVPFTIQGARNSLKLFSETLINVFSLESGHQLETSYRLLFSLSVLVCVLFLTLQLLKGSLIHKPTHVGMRPQVEVASGTDTKFDGVTFAALFIFFIAPINFLGAVVSGGYVDLEGFRYFAGLIAAVVVLAVTVADRDGYLQKHYVALTCRVVGVLLSIVATGFLWTGRKHEIGVPPIVSCLNRIEQSGFHLDSGTADYWYARGVSHYLPEKNWIAATDHDMSPLFWMTSLGPILREKAYGYHYNFVIVRDPGKPIYFDYTAETIGRILPDPSRKIYCPESRATVWIYSDDKLDLALKKAFNQFLFNRGAIGIFEQMGQSMSGMIGRRLGSARVAAEGMEDAGFLSYGPYVPLRNGRYLIRLSYSVQSGNSANYIDMIGSKNGKTGIQIFRQDLQNEGEHQVSTVIDTGKGNIENFEVRTWFSGHGKLAVNSLEISKAP